ncbi:MAG: protein kinase, partial [Polyangiales bacterium]
MAEETKQCTTCGRRFTDDALFCPKDGSALVPASAVKGKDAFVGREILGHIEIRSLIGSGAMGRVYRAHQKGIDRDVAVKILHKELAQNPDLVARFLREAKVASRLAHPNVVQVLLAGQLEDQTMYLVMEYLDGISLQSALVGSGGALPIARALHIALQICDAVGEAHGVGVVHRDVKPENVMLVKRGDDPDFAKVLDFGIAHLTQKESGIETQAGLVFGTARYLSPEGARGESVGPTSDVYATATLVYQMLAGRTPFEHDSSVSLLVAQIHDQAPMLRSFPRAAYVPRSVEEAIMKNLAKDPTARDADGHTFGRALLEAAVSAGFAADDLLFRPAVARAKRSLNPPSIAVPSSEKTKEQPYGIAAEPPPPSQVVIAPRHEPASDPRLPTPEPRPAVYNPSYSGKPMLNAAQTAPAPEKRRVARTIDDAPNPEPEVAPLASAPLGSATVGMSPSPLASP